MRIFKIGTHQIHEDETMSGLSNEEVRVLLQHQGYPEVANATIRAADAPNADGELVVEYLPRPGRKG